MTRRLAVGIGAGLIVAGVAGCLGTTTPSGQQSSGTVAGQVLRSNGDSVGGAIVGFILTTVAVNNVSQLLGQVSILAGDDGRFVQSFVTAVAPQTAVLEILVTPPIGKGLLPLDTVQISVRLGATYPPADTTYVPLVLRSR